MTERGRIQKEFYNTFKPAVPKWMENNVLDFYVAELIVILNENTSVKKGSRILDVGCGRGKIMSRMKLHFKESCLKGFDISEKNVAAARQEGLDVEAGDADNLAIAGKFDLIYGTSILHHLGDIAKFFQNIGEKLNDGGAVLFGAEPPFYQFLNIIWSKLRGQWDVERGMLNISERKIRAYLSDSFTNIKIYRHGNMFVYASRFVGSIWNKLRLTQLPIINDLYIYAEKKL